MRPILALSLIALAISPVLGQEGPPPEPQNTAAAEKTQEESPTTTPTVDSSQRPLVKVEGGRTYYNPSSKVVIQVYRVGDRLAARGGRIVWDDGALADATGWQPLPLVQIDPPPLAPPKPTPTAWQTGTLTHKETGELAKDPETGQPLAADWVLHPRSGILFGLRFPATGPIWPGFPAHKYTIQPLSEEAKRTLSQ